MTKTSNYDTFQAAREALRKHVGEGYIRTSVAELEAQALSYVWGWQDAKGTGSDSGEASEFAWAYGTVAALYALGRIGMRPPIQDAWKSYMEHGEIRDYRGRALNLVSPTA